MYFTDCHVRSPVDTDLYHHVQCFIQRHLPQHCQIQGEQGLRNLPLCSLWCLPDSGSPGGDWGHDERVGSVLDKGILTAVLVYIAHTYPAWD